MEFGWIFSCKLRAGAISLDITLQIEELFIPLHLLCVHTLLGVRWDTGKSESYSILWTFRFQKVVLLLCVPHSIYTWYGHTQQCTIHSHIQDGCLLWLSGYNTGTRFILCYAHGTLSIKLLLFTIQLSWMPYCDYTVL